MDCQFSDGTAFEEPISSFIMMGQSNMAGRGDFGEVPEIHNSRCYMLRMGRWQEMSEPINPDRAIFHSEMHSGVSLAASFADAYANHYREKVGLIPCADGGTSIAQWQPGTLLYDHALMQAGLAGRTSRLKGILWHQGETDCASAADFDAYPERFCTMVSAFRESLGMPELPILMGEISETIPDRWNIPRERCARFNRLLVQLAQTVPNCILVKAADLHFKEDGVHFDSRSQRILGVRYFEGYRSFAERS